MFIKAHKKGAAFTLVEMMVSLAVFSIVGMALMTIYVYSIRSFAALTNYSMLDKENRLAMDKMTFEIRQAKQIVNYTTNGSSSLTILNGNNDTVTYSFNPGSKQMVRQSSAGESQILL